jgi:3'(2'), 5'-bisphosphate nucleotidase
MSNKVITENLTRLTPDIPIISEESAEIPYTKRQYFDFCWIIDPLDGTRGFINRRSEFAINVGLVWQGVPVLGVVFVPPTEGAYFAVKGEGAWKIENGEEIRLHCSTFDPKDKGLRIPASRSHKNKDTTYLIAQYIEPQLIVVGGALKFLYVAEGKADIYPRISEMKEWDTAAPHIIVEEAGGSMLGVYDGQPLKYNKENLLSPNFICAGIMK